MRHLDGWNVSTAACGAALASNRRPVPLVCLFALLAVPSAAAADFCGRPVDEPATLQAAIAKSDGVKQVFDGPEYVAYQDAASEAVYTFSRAAVGAAHPAAVCRKPVKSGETITLQMEIVCRGSSDACQRLESDFKLLNARMEAHIRGVAGDAAAKPK